MRTDEEFLAISKELESHHEIFSKLWQLGKPTLTEQIPTAAVGWDSSGACIAFMFNPKFLEKLNTEDLCFIVAHECMHVILHHGNRLKGLYKEIGNIAADIAINELLLNGFGFKISNWLRNEFGLCTIKSIFQENASKIQRNREFEYYYQQILKDAEVQTAIMLSGAGPLDDHGSIPMEMSEELKDIINGMNKEDVETLKEHIKDEIKGDKSSKSRGDGHMIEWIESRLKPVAKEDWRKVIQDWTIREFRARTKTQWKRTDRRFIDIQRRCPSLIIPSIGPIDAKFGDRIDMVFFMDVSGSCHSQSEAFFAAAKTIPDDKFVIDAKAFDTEIIPINIEDTKLPLGGGTSFNQLESYCLSKGQYPSVVFVLTDGYGTDVKPKYPDRWHIFLTPGGFKDCFKGEVLFHEFKDFNGNT